MALKLPARVQGNAAEGPREEMALTGDASFGGLSFLLKQAVQLGQVLRLDLPLPKTFRRHAVAAPSYHVYALVRSVAPVEDGHRVGVMFMGMTPPKGYADDPTGRFLLPSDPKPAPKDRRQQGRYAVFLNLRIRRVDAGGPGPAEEQTVAENLGKGGAQVMTSLPLSKGDLVEVEELGGSFRSRAVVKNLFIGKDNVPRLNLQFQTETPDRLIPSGGG